MRRLVDRKLLAKAVGYRLFVALFDLGVVSVSFQLSGNIVISIVVLNLLKLAGYYMWDVLWLKPEFRTRLRIIDRVLRLLKARNG
jgi:uncharacterized membrane protein